MQIVNRLEPLRLLLSLTVVSGSLAEVVPKLGEGMAFLLVMLTEESKHVAVLADEVIVEED